MKNHITPGDVLRQLKADLIGKDSYRGVTLTYSWMANQFGHYSLGYIPTLIVYSILESCFSNQRSAFWAALVVSTLWLLFELYNFLGPLLLNKQSQSNLLFFAGKEYTFKPAWVNIAFDTFTDLCFFWFGAFSASLFLNPIRTNFFILAILLLVLIYPCRYWFLTKMYLQSAQYPFQFRLSQWENHISELDKQTVNQFLEDRSGEKHLFVFGGRKSGKTTISVGIATERSVKHEACMYTTGMKLYSMFQETDLKLLSDNKALWTWRNASLLIIDDINPGDPITEDLITSDQFLALLDGPVKPNNENRKNVRNKNVIWVMGNEKEEKSFFSDWKTMLVEIGVEPENIYSINLKSNPD